MKQKRFAALLCALVLALSVCSAASAKTMVYSTTNGSIDWDNNYLVKNGETVSIETFAHFWNAFVKNSEGSFDSYSDVQFDCDSAVKGKASASWIRVVNGKRGFTIDLDNNESQKARSGKITVTGKNFKATLKIKQYGRNMITSAVRKKNKVTLKLKQSAGTVVWLDVSASKTLEDGTYVTRNLISNPEYGESSYTFKVEKGWSYDINYGVTIKTTTGWYAASSDYVYIPRIEKTTGTETYR